MNDLIKIFKNVEFSYLDIIDFLLLWFIIFQFLKLFKGTRTIYIILGVLILLTIIFLADILKLSA
ncbi:MAG: hypothetical protein ABIL76_09460, partial [candidate division WOR-3 bacterium]